MKFAFTGFALVFVMMPAVPPWTALMLASVETTWSNPLRSSVPAPMRSGWAAAAVFDGVTRMVFGAPLLSSVLPPRKL